jgi:hypothetical protein
MRFENTSVAHWDMHMASAFSALARGAGALEQLLVPLEKMGAVRLFGLLTDACEAVAVGLEHDYRARKCLLDELLLAVLAKWPTAALLQSEAPSVDRHQLVTSLLTTL